MIFQLGMVIQQLPDDDLIVELEGKTWLVGLFSTSRFFDIESPKVNGYGHVSMFTRLDLVLPWLQQNTTGGWLLGIH